jgi:hypothetical protein
MICIKTKNGIRFKFDCYEIVCKTCNIWTNDKCPGHGMKNILSKIIKVETSIKDKVLNKRRKKCK